LSSNPWLAIHNSFLGFTGSTEYFTDGTLEAEIRISEDDGFYVLEYTFKDDIAYFGRQYS